MRFRQNAVYMPADKLFLFLWDIQNDANGEKIIDLFKRHLLLFDLVVNRRYRFGPADDAVWITDLIKVYLKRFDKLADVSLALLFAARQFLLNLLVYLRLLNAQYDVLQL